MRSMESTDLCWPHRQNLKDNDIRVLQLDGLHGRIIGHGNRLDILSVLTARTGKGPQVRAGGTAMDFQEELFQKTKAWETASTRKKIQMILTAANIKETLQSRKENNGSLESMGAV